MGISTEKAKKNTKKTDEKKEKTAKRGKTPVELMNEVANKVPKDVNKEAKNMEDKTEITTAKAEDTESLNKIMDPTPQEVMDAIKKGNAGEACYRISLCDSSTVGTLKEFLAEIPDDTLVRVCGQTNGFAQMDTTYPDLNFCVPEEQGCCDCKESETVHMTQYLIDFADVIHDYFSGKGDPNYMTAMIQACEELGLNPDAMTALAMSIAESTTETHIEKNLYLKFLQVIGLTEALFFGKEFNATFQNSCCEDGCIMQDEEFMNFLHNIIQSDGKKRKILSRVEYITEHVKLHLNIRSKKKGKKFKKLTDEELQIVLESVIPEGVSSFKVVRQYPFVVEVEFDRRVKNPFGKRPKNDEIAEVFCHACNCGDCEQMTLCDDTAMPKVCDENTTTISTKIHDAQCICDDEDDE